MRVVPALEQIDGHRVPCDTQHAGQLGHMREVEAHHEGAVSSRTQYLEQEFCRGLLFKLESGADRGTRINEQADTQRQVGLLGKVVNLGRWHLVVKQRKVFGLQVIDEFAMLIRDREDQVDLIDAGLENVAATVILRCGLCGSCLGRSLLRRVPGGGGTCRGV